MTNLTIPKYLTQAETKNLFRAIENKRDKAIFLVAYCHGLRPSEVGLLQVGDVDLARGRIRITRLKNGNSAEHPLQPAEVRALRAWMKDRNQFMPFLFYGIGGGHCSTLGISRRALHKLITKYGERAGIPEGKRHFKILRHSIATHMMEAGADIRFVQMWLGHRNIQNTTVYAQISDPNRDQQATRLFANPMIVVP